MRRYRSKTEVTFTAIQFYPEGPSADWPDGVSFIQGEYRIEVANGLYVVKKGDWIVTEHGSGMQSRFHFQPDAFTRSFEEIKP